MGPRWPRALRFAQGDELRCTLDLPAGMRASLEQASARAAFWLSIVDDAVIGVERLGDDRLVLRLESEPASVRLEATVASELAFDVRADVRRGTDVSDLTVAGVAIMLGGSRDAIIARRGEAGTALWLRLRYDSDQPGAGAELAVYTAPFAHRLPASVRALLPSVVTVARLARREAGVGSAG